eukprot:7653971-Ditylum_brightwellii.AAC.1
MAHGNHMSTIGTKNKANLISLSIKDAKSSYRFPLSINILLKIRSAKVYPLAFPPKHPFMPKGKPSPMFTSPMIYLTSKMAWPSTNRSKPTNLHPTFMATHSNKCAIPFTTAASTSQPWSFSSTNGT